MGITELTQRKGFKLFMGRLYGWGAAVVILGALFKIQHYPGAGLMLIIGLGTEATIFFFSGFEPPHEEVDWSLVYPELAGMQDEDKKTKLKKSDPVAQYLDRMLADARIGTDLIQGLGTGLKSLGENTSRMADLSNASVATDDYVKNVNRASQSIGNMSTAYEKAAHATDQLANSADDIRSYRDQVSNAGKNLAALNAVYELQLQDSNSHLKQTSKFYEGINELMANLNSSLEDTKKYKDEVAMLARNLSQLNQVYGNMLSAMTIR